MVGLQPRIIRLAYPESRTTFIARRLLSGSTCSYAEHSNYATRPKASPSLSSGLDERSRHAQHLFDVEYDAQGNEINPYKNGPSALDKAVHLFFFTEIIRGAEFQLDRCKNLSWPLLGMWIVLENFFRPPYTIMYPFEKGPLSPRFRGEHALRRYPSGEERCIGTYLKATEMHVILTPFCKLANFAKLSVRPRLLPLKAKLAWMVRGRPLNTVSIAQILLDYLLNKSLDIDMTKCIYCGFCQEACPVDAIVESACLVYFLAS